jgi:hypothetical protein
MECTLCQFNPVRLCERNFGKKYLVSDALKAKCGASIKVEMVDALGQRVEKDLPSVQFEVCSPSCQSHPQRTVHEPAAHACAALNSR